MIFSTQKNPLMLRFKTERKITKKIFKTFSKKRKKYSKQRIY